MGTEKIINHLDAKGKQDINLKGFGLMRLVQGAIRIQLNPEELNDEELINEYNQKLYQESHFNRASFLEELYNSWYDKYPKHLMKCFNKLYPTIKYDLLDENSYGY